MTLQATLDAFRANWERRIGTGASCTIDNEVELACVSLDATLTARPGTKFPQKPHLVDERGMPFDFSRFAVGKPLVVKVYRGGWCPFCRIDLRAFEALYSKIKNRGAGLIAISPETPENIANTVAENDLTYPLVSDVGGSLTKQLGLHLALSKDMVSFLQKSGLDLGIQHGSDNWFLPAPAVFILSSERVIAEAFFSPDFRKRVEPEKIVNLI